MAGKRQTQTHSHRLTVRLNRSRLYSVGLGLHRTTDLDPDAVYSVLATYSHEYEDGSIEPVSMHQGPNRSAGEVQKAGADQDDGSFHLRRQASVSRQPVQAQIEWR